MNTLAFCTIFMVLWLGSSIQAELTAERYFVSKSTGNKILNDQEELNDDYKALLLEFAMNHFGEYQRNVVLSSIGCSICSRILGVLMDASVESFLTVNDIVAINYSSVENGTEIDPVIRYDGLVVFLMEDVSEFFKHFAKLRLMYAWNPRAQHLIFTVKKPNDKELELIFEECWSRKVLNVAVMIWNQEEAYTYNPYLKHHSGMREKVRNWSRLFYDKLRNMNGYVIQTKYVPFSGTDVAKWIKEEVRFKFYGSDFGYAEAFFQSINATPAFINLTVDTVLCYQSFNYRYSIWKERKFNSAELWMNSMPLQSPLRDRYEKTYPVRRDNVRVLVPKSSLKMPSIFEPYNNITWICVVLSLITFALYSRVLYIRRGIDDNAFFRTFGIFLGKNLANRRHGLLEKFTFLVFTMTSLIILSAYQGALYSALATISYYPEINTMSQLQRRIKTINAYRLFAEYLQKYAELGISVVEFGTMDYIEYMKIHQDEAYAYPNNMAQVTAKLKSLSENGIPFYHVMKDYSFPAFLSHAVPYGSPYLKKLEGVFLACKEAGLEQYWEAEANLNDILSGTIISNVVEEKPLRKLSLQTQLIGFYIWGLGLLVSFFCFTTEIYFHKYKKNMLTRIQQPNNENVAYTRCFLIHK